MLSLKEATDIVGEWIPNGNIQAVIDYKDVYLFQVFTDDALEGQWDLFFSVNKETGEFRDFSITTDGEPGEITRLFQMAKQ
jgi:hypothetical protein